MSKVVVKFTKGWGKYNAKDIAGFDQKVADDLIDTKKVAKLHKGGGVEKLSVKIEIGTEGVEKVVAEAEARLKAEGKKLEREAAVLNKREVALDKLDAKLGATKKDLDAREVALLEREKAVKDADPALEDPAGKTPTSETSETPAAAGKPPKQGAK